MQVCIRASLHSTQGNTRKKQMHGHANELNVATWMHEWGYYVGVRIASTLFYIFCPVGNVLAIRTISLRLAGGTENIERLES